MRLLYLVQEVGFVKVIKSIVTVVVLGFIGWFILSSLF